MTITTVDAEFMLNIPSQFQEYFRPGGKVSINVDSSGRLIITPTEMLRARLKETSGMWADRDDIPADGITYVDEVREGHRLDVFDNETD